MFIGMVASNMALPLTDKKHYVTEIRSSQRHHVNVIHSLCDCVDAAQVTRDTNTRGNESASLLAPELDHLNYGAPTAKQREQNLSGAHDNQFLAVKERCTIAE
ncbi:hypothetical protein CEXT_611451 [Caerostris extrusa]|uniref:Uncharacterized protein n=1 Tax=Caerostris extrusa TaxID=172846 RepID=A0AAV4SPC5_CAEEX|nr:hypothetical protein CEXT_611451 [Caerostris extrusa]